MRKVDASALPEASRGDCVQFAAMDTHRTRRWDIGKSWVSTLLLWWHRARTRRALRLLDRSLLVDLGLSEADCRQEAAKWFWQD